jgi:hypothetical protein
MQRKMMMGVAASILALVIGSLCVAQPPVGGDRGARGGRGGDQGGPGQRQFDPAQMQQRMIEGFKQRLGVDDAAWQVMQPRLMKVMELSRQTSGMGRGGMMMGGFRGQRDGGPGGAGGPGGPQGDRRGPQGPTGEQTALEKAMTQLRTTLENESASTEEIKKQLTAVRQAREKAKQELAVAQQELKQILTLKQEAQLLTMGLVD